MMHYVMEGYGRKCCHYMILNHNRRIPFPPFFNPARSYSEMRNLGSARCEVLLQLKLVVDPPSRNMTSRIEA